MKTFIGGVVAALVVAAFLFVTGWGAWQARELGLLRDRERATALTADSAEAARDSTRAVSISGLRSVLNDSVRVYQRRIVQTAQVADSLDRALMQERAAQYEAAVVIDALHAQLSAPVVVAGDTMRRADFTLRQPPYSIVASVTLPPAPGDGTMMALVSVDTAVFEARVGCGAVSAGGVRPATLTLSGPTWVGVRLARLEQEARVCGAVEETTPQSGWWASRAVSRVSLTTFGVGAAIGRDGRVSAGPAAVVGFRVGTRE